MCVYARAGAHVCDRLFYECVQVHAYLCPLCLCAFINLACVCAFVRTCVYGVRVCVVGWVCQLFD